MTKDELIDYATRYIDASEIVPFPGSGEPFAFFVREIPIDRILDENEGWEFAGYNICTGYTLDDDSKPAGKWVWLNYLSLIVYPPRASAFKLQPPHVCKARWQNPSRTQEYRMVVLDIAHPYGGIATAPNKEAEAPRSNPATTEEPATNILSFPKKKRLSRAKGPDTPPSA